MPFAVREHGDHSASDDESNKMPYHLTTPRFLVRVHGHTGAGQTTWFA
jgi:hypothetical protein